MRLTPRGGYGYFGDTGENGESQHIHTRWFATDGSTIPRTEDVGGDAIGFNITDSETVPTNGYSLSHNRGTEGEKGGNSLVTGLGFKWANKGFSPVANTLTVDRPPVYGAGLLGLSVLIHWGDSGDTRVLLRMDKRNTGSYLPLYSMGSNSDGFDFGYELYLSDYGLKTISIGVMDAEGTWTSKKDVANYLVGSAYWLYAY